MKLQRKGQAQPMQEKTPAKPRPRPSGDSLKKHGDKLAKVVKQTGRAS